MIASDGVDPRPESFTLDEVRESLATALAWVREGLLAAHGPGCSGHENLETLLHHMAELAIYGLALRFRYKDRDEGTTGGEE